MLTTSKWSKDEDDKDQKGSKGTTVESLRWFDARRRRRSVATTELQPSMRSTTVGKERSEFQSLDPM
jgi:hypothetical protein